MSLTLKERIELRLLDHLAARLPVWMAEEVEAGRATAADAARATVERHDVRGNADEAFALIIVPGPESTAAGGEGQPSLDTTVVPIELELCVAKPPLAQDPESSAATFNRWLGRLHRATCGKASASDDGLLDAAEQLTDDAPDHEDEILALHVLKTGSSNPPLADRQPEFFVILQLNVHFDTYRGDPYAGPGSTERSA